MLGSGQARSEEEIACPIRSRLDQARIRRFSFDCLQGNCRKTQRKVTEGQRKIPRSDAASMSQILQPKEDSHRFLSISNSKGEDSNHKLPFIF